MDSVIYTRIRELCEERGITVTKLESLMGMSQSSIGRWRSTASPSAENLAKVARFFGVSLDYLIGDTDIQSRDLTVRAICQYTGLSEQAVTTLSELSQSSGSQDTKMVATINLLLEDRGIEEWGSQLLQRISDYILADPIPKKHLQFTSEAIRVLEHEPDALDSTNTEYADVLYDKLLLDRMTRAAEEARSQLRNPQTMAKMCRGILREGEADAEH